MNLSDLLDRPIAFQRSFVTLTKSINAALFLSQAIYWSKRTDDADGWFYKKQSDWEDETGLTRREQDTARKNLRDLGVMEESLEGVPATLYFRVNVECLRARLAETAAPVRSKTPSKIGGKRQTIYKSETTPETTAKDSLVLSVGNQHYQIPENLRTPEFLASWEDWLADRKERRQPVTARAAKIHLAKCSAWGPIKASAVIAMAIEKGWRGLFEEIPHSAQNRKPTLHIHDEEELIRHQTASEAA